MSEAEIINITKDLLGAIDRRDYDAYRDMTVPHISCFEPETMGNVVDGLEFHKYYFDRFPAEDCPVTIVNPRVHMIGTDGACIAYIRLRQRMNAPGKAVTVKSQETRVWQKINGKWKNIHFHSTASE
ncbi:calcium/calmodulin-dependent protein kinase type II alpha chain-like isoform X4 [Ptychodera flava]|uniref:calcium/calmodulin-dependent protein kinase type II alpha chain-like isoform X4 n=1 Tax=Ptychodera flava TaxID=63121 RepID=UPI00396A1886